MEERLIMGRIPEGILDGGRKLPLVEDFYTIQGEGYHTGKPAYFIRLGGCDVGCRWCDAKMTWNPALYPPVEVDDIIQRACSYPARAIVITGGEPLLYPLDYLTGTLKDRGLEIFLETSGSQPLSGVFDWVCLSPKKQQPPLVKSLARADELKVIISQPDDIVWAEENAARVRAECLLYMQPEWSRSAETTPLIVDYVKKHPRWNISIQTHKYMRIP
ncbi:MAG: 7-carboxy-7-deazaguanine synthase QueE [Alistipes sp.]|nr:7-carboxy-7-deazaguanine synthase QueE [Alistipes sp.]